MSILSVDIDTVNLDDVNFDEDDPQIIIRYQQCKSSKKEIILQKLIL